MTPVNRFLSVAVGLFGLFDLLKLLCSSLPLLLKGLRDSVFVIINNYSFPIANPRNHAVQRRGVARLCERLPYPLSAGRPF